LGKQKTHQANKC
jgi:CheY-like chemotaxis protein